MRQIDVEFAPANAVQQSFPVHYALESSNDGRSKIIHCRLGLPQAQWPAWLTCGSFRFIMHLLGDIPLVDHDISSQEYAASLDAEAFRYKVYAAIFVRELHVSI